ncbi:MAG TPA: winged helix DNA-binding domain-containing protein [Acidimicrobiales bacterium]
MLKTSWSQVVAWRMRQQWVDRPGTASTVDVVRRLCGVQAQVPSAAALAVEVRQSAPEPRGLHQALARKELMRTWAMRGTLHALPPDTAGAFLSLCAATRSWEKGSWQRVFKVKPDEMVELVAAVGEILDGRVLTRDELVAEAVERLENPDIEEELRSGWGTLLKPIAWQGMLCHGPAQGNKVTFTRPSSHLPTWGGVPEPDEAAAVAVPAYLRAYGPASPETFDAWLTRGNNRKAPLRRWFADRGDALATVDVEGEELYLNADDVDALAATEPATATTVRLLPAFDQYVLGPGTSAVEIVPPAHRPDVSRTGGWIAPVVVAGGRVAGVWDVADDTVAVQLWDDVEPPDPSALAAEVERITDLVRRTPDTEPA